MSDDELASEIIKELLSDAVGNKADLSDAKMSDDELASEIMQEVLSDAVLSDAVLSDAKTKKVCVKKAHAAVDTNATTSVTKTIKKNKSTENMSDTNATTSVTKTIKKKKSTEKKLSDSEIETRVLSIKSKIQHLEKQHKTYMSKLHALTVVVT